MAVLFLPPVAERPAGKGLRDDDNNIAGVEVVNQGVIVASAVKQENEWLGADSGQVANANGNIWIDGL